MLKLRTGRKVGRTIYVQHGTEPTDHDRIIGLVDDGWAPVLVHAYNAWMRDGNTDTHEHFWTRESHFGEDYKRCPCGVVIEADPETEPS